MRAIKFRGKSVETGHWTYGDLVRESYGTFIHTVEQETYVPSPGHEPMQRIKYSKISVKPETIGEIVFVLKITPDLYEGDVVKYDGMTWEVRWSHVHARFQLHRDESSRNENSGCLFYQFRKLTAYQASKCEIIGTIYDIDPEVIPCQTT